MTDNIHIFTEELAYKAPAPKGGGAAAFVWVLGAALGTYACPNIDV